MATTVDPQPLGKEEFNPFGPAFRNDPEAFYGDLVRQSLGFMTMEGVRSSWVGSYAECLAVLRDPARFSSLKPKGLPGMERVDFFNGLPVMNYSDPPDHTRRRKVVNAAFLPKRTEPLNVEAGRIIDEVFDRVVDRGGGIDAVGELTKPLSLEILLDHFLKVDKQDQRIFTEYFGTFHLFDKLKPGDPKPQPFLDVWQEGQDYCRRQYALAQEGKCDNLIGLIARSVDEGQIGEDEMLAMMIVLLIGGVSTVAAAAGSALLRLAWNPDIADRIRADLSLAARHHEESLRIDPPVATVLRFGKSTWFMHNKLQGDEVAFAAKYALGTRAGEYAIHGGGWPVRVRGVEGVVAVVVVSGLKQEQDHGVVVQCVAELLEGMGVEVGEKRKED